MRLARSLLLKLEALISSDSLTKFHVFHEVIGCVGESDRGKRPLMTKIATDKSDVTLLTSDNPKTEDPCKCGFYKALKEFMPPLMVNQTYYVILLKLIIEHCVSRYNLFFFLYSLLFFFSWQNSGTG